MSHMGALQTRFGRVPSPPDPRDNEHPMRLALATSVPLIQKHWRPGPLKLDQDGIGACVGFAGNNWKQDAPRRTTVDNQDGFDDYFACKQIDGIPNIEGTYIRALMKVYQDQGRISEYLWSTTEDEFMQWLITRGTIIVGTNWYESMMQPETRSDGTIVVSGGVVGGHAWVCRGYVLAKDAVRGQNSWSGSWGKNGEFLIKRETLMRLIFQEGGEAVGMVEKKRILSSSTID